MTQATAVIVILCAAGLAAAGQAVIYAVDISTARQCRAHDWPVEADQKHRDWCITNGYEI